MPSTRNSSASISLLLILFVQACASFEPKTPFQELLKSREPSASQVLGNLHISVEEFASASKSRMAFTEDLVSYKVLPILVRVKNDGDKDYRIYRRDIKALLGDKPLAPMTSRDAADASVASEYAGKAIGWTLATGPFALLVWPATVAASARHTQGVNQRVYQYFQGTEFNDGIMKAAEETAGFVYFKVPDTGKRIEDLVIEFNAMPADSDSRLTVKLAIPPIDVGS